MYRRDDQCWGSNEAGQLGLGDVKNRGSGPNEMGDSLDYVDLGTDVTAQTVAAGWKHTCAIVTTSDVKGGVKCWGEFSNAFDSVKPRSVYYFLHVACGTDFVKTSHALGDSKPCNMDEKKFAFELK